MLIEGPLLPRRRTKAREGFLQSDRISLGGLFQDVSGITPEQCETANAE